MANQVNVSTTTNKVTITPQNTTNVSVGASTTSVNLTQGSTSIVQVVSQGPQGIQGPKGDTGATGPQGPIQDTGSLLLTASYSNPNLTFTKGNGDTFNLEIETTFDTSSLLTTASYSNPNLTFTKGDGDTFDVVISTDTPTLQQVTDQGAITTTAITASNISASGFITADSFNGRLVGTASVATVASSLYSYPYIDSFSLGFPSTVGGGLGSGGTYFLSLYNTSASKQDFGFSSLNATEWVDRCIPCNDLDGASNINIKVTGVLNIVGTVNPLSNRFRVNLYKVSLTEPISDPLSISLVSQGSLQTLDDGLLTLSQSAYFSQNFNGISLNSDDAILVSISNATKTIDITTGDVKTSLRLSREYTK